MDSAYSWLLGQCFEACGFRSKLQLHCSSQASEWDCGQRRIVGDVMNVWKAILKGDREFTAKDGTFLDIPEPIVALEVMGGKVEGAEAYYLVFHAVARPGQARGRVEAIEFGGVFGDVATGWVVTREKAFPKSYPLKSFPFSGALKPGIRSN